MQRNIFELLKLVVPWDVSGPGKARVGPLLDGGFVLLDELEQLETVVSCTRGADFSSELELARMGKDVFLFGSAPDAVPPEASAIRFSRTELVPDGHPETGNAASLDLMLKGIDWDSEKRVLLKLDVEGVEWDVPDRIVPETLVRFSQLVIEFHWCCRLSEPSFRAQWRRVFGKLNERFVLFHVHANNCGGMGSVEGSPFPNVLELSYARADGVERLKSRTLYPTKLDFPNDPSAADPPLWFFPFFPGSGDVAWIGRAPSIPQESAERSRSLKILYHSVHLVLEYDELTLFSGMGHDVFSLGAYFAHRRDEARADLDFRPRPEFDVS